MFFLCSFVFVLDITVWNVFLRFRLVLLWSFRELVFYFSSHRFIYLFSSVGNIDVWNVTPALLLLFLRLFDFLFFFSCHFFYIPIFFLLNVFFSRYFFTLFFCKVVGLMWNYFIMFLYNLVVNICGIFILENIFVNYFLVISVVKFVANFLVELFYIFL